MKLAHSVFCLLFICGLGRSVSAQEHRFKTGERLEYKVYYYLMGIWVSAGDVKFTVEEGVHANQSCFHFQGVGNSHPRYNWFYEVHDTYESFSDRVKLTPFTFKRDISEGNNYMIEKCVFEEKTNKIYSVQSLKNNPVQIDTSELIPGSFDVLSMIYHARNLEFDQFTVGQKIPLNMFIDKETHSIFIRFLGVEIYDHDDFGALECYVFSPLLVDGTLFKSGENMKVYVTKDKNQIPVYVESDILVGSVRIVLKSHDDLKAKLGEN
jgi:hypothetical protein